MTTQSKYPEDPRVGENIFETTQISHSQAINHAQMQPIYLKKILQAKIALRNAYHSLILAKKMSEKSIKC